MSLLWLFPAGLAALAALLLPLLIHLARRDQQQLIDFAALRWLSAKPRPRHRIRFDDWPLLLVRLLLLALLAVLLARPALQGLRDATPRVVVVPGVTLDSARAAFTGQEARWLWLAPGFPAIDQNTTPATAEPAITSLLRELDATLPAEAALTVILPSTVDGWDAQRLQLSRDVDWQVIEAPVAALPATPRPAPQLQVRHDNEGAAALPYLRAVNQAWHPGATLASADDSQAFAGADGVRVWLSAKPLPADLLDGSDNGGVLLVDARQPLPKDAQRTPLWQDAGGRPLIEQVVHGTHRWLRWTTAMQPTTLPVLLDAGFPQHLQAVLQPTPVARRALATAMQPGTGATTSPPAVRELADWLVVAIALLFLQERWLASAARRRRQP